MLTVSFHRLPLYPGDFVLDAGCGEGRHTFECIRHDCVVLGMDLSRQSLLKARYVLGEMEKQKKARGRVLLLRGDALRFPFADETFDKIICAEVIEHVEDERKGVAELARILCGGGKIAITVPTLLTEHVYDQLSSEYFRTPGGHVRKIVPGDLARILEENGLRVYAVGFAHSFHSPYWMLRCIFGLPKEDALIPALYRKFLHFSLFSPPLRFLEKVCNYFFPKSIILYAQKDRHEDRGPRNEEKKEERG
jgi:SAM-dependent methyltransferase